MESEPCYTTNCPQNISPSLPSDAHWFLLHHHCSFLTTDHCFSHRSRFHLNLSSPLGKLKTSSLPESPCIPQQRNASSGRRATYMEACACPDRKSTRLNSRSLRHLV